MFRTVLILSLSLLVVSAASAETPTQGDVAGRVQALLSGYERVPTPADWQAAGPTEMVARALLDVAKRGDERTSTRARALTGMRYAPTDGVRAYLESVAVDASMQSVLRGKAALSLGKIAQQAALPVLSKLLASDDVPLREAALRGIGEVQSREAIELLVTHEGRESEAHVRELARSLAGSLRATVP